ncbi:coiled-coil domain-containing protein 114-like isoform X1 [Arapaima gigas]
MPRRRSARSVHSDSSETEIDNIANLEMTKLQRQFRMMEGDRQAYSIQAQDQIRTQRLEIERLQEEQEELQCRFQVSQSHSHQQQDVDTSQAMQRLLNQRDEVEVQLERQKESIIQLEQEILSMEKKLAGLRRTRTTVDQKQKSVAYEKKKAARSLENKLDRTLVRFNEQLTKNAQLRADIDTLRLERVRFQQLQRKLDKELQEIHREIREMVNQSTVAYDVRVEAKSKMILLKEKAVKDLAQYGAEMKELERIIAHEQRLKDFMSTKGSERSRHEDNLDPTHSQEFEERERKRMDKGEDTADSLEEVFRRIQGVIGEEDLDLLVSRFIQVEEQNFALFNYVNEQNNEAESLKDQIKQIQQEMDQFHTDQESEEAKHHTLLKDIDTRKHEAEVRAQTYESQATEASKILDQIKTGVGRMFHKLECDYSVIKDMLGSSTEIRDTNIMTYLSLLENRTNQLLSMQVFLISKNLDNSYNEKDVPWFLSGQSLDMQIENLSIQPPGPGDDYETEGSFLTDEDERPLTQKELRQRIMAEVLQKEAAAQSSGEKDDKDFRITSQQRRFQDFTVDVSPSPL